ncbi:NADPH-dependent 1-acyl dihydroxyacetone phosphate reductase [Collariella sp. IMI 366227]|nr:NADPH-dependent 1-acyl dihydroxyacetone phosphate reductase [Collariella sp. IMI 366227]
MVDMGPKPGQKTVLITGCTPGGIGHALALEFYAKGVHVFATARNPAVLAEMADMGMTCLPLDVTNEESIKACHDDVSKITGGKLDILVNNAYIPFPFFPHPSPLFTNPSSGRTHTHPATDISLPDVRETFETNVFGVMAMVASFSDLLISARGLIINIASLAAITPYAFGSVYCASKGAITAYSRTLRLELKPFGVRVMVAMTGTNNATVETGDYARRLVGKALAKEWPMVLRAWLGRPDWFWAGGMATKVWFASWVGEWVTDVVAYRMIGLNKIEEVLREEERVKKLK